MEKEIERIFNRQFERCNAEVQAVNCPQIYIDSMSKYFNFAKLDIKEIMENGKNSRQYNSKQE